MRCIHGNKIRVILEPMNKDSHIIYKTAYNDKSFIKIIGCEYCKWIEVIIENYIPDIAERDEKDNEIHISEIKISEIQTLCDD